MIATGGKESQQGRLEARNLSFSFGPRAIFQGLELELASGDSFAIWGSSGSGKSTLMKLLAGLVPPGGGWVRFEGVDLASASKKALQNLRIRMGIVFQEGALISNLSIYDNIALPLRYHFQMDEGIVRERVEKIMALLGIDRDWDRAIPAQISAGGRKRAAFARALILKPSLLLLDEPTHGLEEETARRIVQVLKKYQEETGAAILFTTGEEAWVLSLANRIGLLQDGRILREGAPAEILSALRKEKSLPAGPGT
jgi:phospholipid/cholesterol/gamma-HCH transport system ATP-binding protein